MPTGTMANEASLKTLTQPGDEVVVESTSHIVLFENGAPGLVSGVVLRTLDAPDARLDPDAVRSTIRPRQGTGPRTAAVWLEDTHNARGGRAVPIEAIRAVSEVAHEANVPVFLDGARIFNAGLATATPVASFAAEVDALTFCFSKGLGAPAGSMVMGTRDFIERLGFYRRALGGSMRQVGLLAAAAGVALDTGIDRLADDHANARRLAEGFADALPGCVDPSAVETNILYVDVGRDAEPVVAAMRDDGVRVGAVGPTRFRAVTHRDVTRQGVDRAIDSFARAVRG
jgi:threonine aldolase